MILSFCFGVNGALVERDAGAAGRALRHAVAETLDHVGLAVALDILQRDQKAAGRRRVVMKIAAAPGVDIEHAVRRDRHVADMAEIVGEHRGAEAGRKRDAAIVAGASIGRSILRRGLCQSLRHGRRRREIAEMAKSEMVERKAARRWRMATRLRMAVLRLSNCSGLLRQASHFNDGIA